MRRKDRQIINFNEIYDIIKRCDICRIALNNDGYPYILPLNFGVSVENEKIVFYFHSALEGKKLELIEKDNRAGFELDCSHDLEYFEEKGYCTYAYESVIGRGHILMIEDEKEKFEALEILMLRFRAQLYISLRLRSSQLKEKNRRRGKAIEQTEES